MTEDTLKRYVKVCTGCSKEEEYSSSTPTDPTAWWNCSNYYKISGLFCGECYDKISHDSYGQPKNPGAYTFMLLKLSGK